MTFIQTLVRQDVLNYMAGEPCTDNKYMLGEKNVTEPYIPPNEAHNMIFYLMGKSKCVYNKR